MKIGTKAAAIDVGTHSVRMLCATYDGNGFIGRKRLVITRLGEGLVKSNRLSDEAVRRTAKAVRDFVGEARKEGVEGLVFCYATSAAREAQNGQEFLAKLRSIEGLEAEIIDGQREAMLAYQGAAALGSVVMDIGGGSTELSSMQNGIFLSHSVPLGTVTSLERFMDRTHEINQKMVESMEEHGRPMVNLLCRAVIGEGKTPFLVGVGGTATQLAMLFLKLPAYDPARIQGFKMSIEELDHMQSQLLQMTAEQRRKMPGMHPKRADVIVPGCLIARMAMTQTGADSLIASDLDGLDAYLLCKSR